MDTYRMRKACLLLLACFVCKSNGDTLAPVAKEHPQGQVAVTKVAEVADPLPSSKTGIAGREIKGQPVDTIPENSDEKAGKIATAECSPLGVIKFSGFHKLIDCHGLLKALNLDVDTAKMFLSYLSIFFGQNFSYLDPNYESSIYFFRDAKEEIQYCLACRLSATGKGLVDTIKGIEKYSCLEMGKTVIIFEKEKSIASFIAKDKEFVTKVTGNDPVWGLCQVTDTNPKINVIVPKESIFFKVKTVGFVVTLSLFEEIMDLSLDFSSPELVEIEKVLPKNNAIPSLFLGQKESLQGYWIFKGLNEIIKKVLAFTMENLKPEDRKEATSTMGLICENIPGAGAGALLQVNGVPISFSSITVPYSGMEELVKGICGAEGEMQKDLASNSAGKCSDDSKRQENSKEEKITPEQNISQLTNILNSMKFLTNYKEQKIYSGNMEISLLGIKFNNTNLAPKNKQFFAALIKNDFIELESLDFLKSQIDRRSSGGVSALEGLISNEEIWKANFKISGLLLYLKEQFPNLKNKIAELEKMETGSVESNATISAGKFNFRLSSNYVAIIALANLVKLISDEVEVILGKSNSEKKVTEHIVPLNKDSTKKQKFFPAKSPAKKVVYNWGKIRNNADRQILIPVKIATEYRARC